MVHIGGVGFCDRYHLFLCPIDHAYLSSSHAHTQVGSNSVAGLLADVPPCAQSTCIHDLALNETEVKSSSFVSPCMCVSISERGRRGVGLGGSE